MNVKLNKTINQIENEQKCVKTEVEKNNEKN